MQYLLIELASEKVKFTQSLPHQLLSLTQLQPDYQILQQGLKKRGNLKLWVHIQIVLMEIVGDLE
jgi:hypothetical protein